VSKVSDTFWVLSFSYGTIEELGECLYVDERGPRFQRKASYFRCGQEQ
jgi:hypothetical protein